MDFFSFFSSLIRAMLNDDVIRSIVWIEAAWEKWFAHPYMPSSENWNEMMTHKNHWEIVRKTERTRIRIGIQLFIRFVFNLFCSV